MKQPIKIIAEIANAHQGSVDNAIQLAIEVNAAGADIVKFQIYFADELLVDDHPRFEHFSKQSFDAEAWGAISLAMQDAGVSMAADVFGIKAFKTAMEIGCTTIKIHSSDLSNNFLLSEVNQHENLDVLLSTGGATAPEIANALNRLSNVSNITALHGFQAYPTPLESTNLSRIRWLTDTFGNRCSIGYQDHVDAEGDFVNDISLCAVAMGAGTIEKHVTLDRAARGVDYFSSLEPKEFAKFVIKLRAVATSFGLGTAEFSHEEKDYRKGVFKVLVANEPIRKGEEITSDKLTYKRCFQQQIHNLAPERVIGRVATRSIERNQTIRGDVAKQVVTAAIVARFESTRLPGKATKVISGEVPLRHLLRRVHRMKRVDHIALCTTTSPSDDVLVDIARQEGAQIVRAGELNVLERLVQAIQLTNADVMLRITGDDILIDPEYGDRAIEHHLNHNNHYTDLKALPSGTELEVFDSWLLNTISNACLDGAGTEYLTTYVTQNKQHLQLGSCPVAAEHACDYRLTLDTVEDYQLIRLLLAHMRKIGKINDYSVGDIVAFLKARPDVAKINAEVRQRSTPIEVEAGLSWGKLVNDFQSTPRP